MSSMVVCVCADCAFAAIDAMLIKFWSGKAMIFAGEPLAEKRSVV